MIFGNGEVTRDTGHWFHRQLTEMVSAVALVAAPLLLAPGFVRAQTPQPILTNPVPQGSPIPRILPPAPPGVSIEGIVPPAPDAAGAISGPPVTITQVSVEGVTIYPPAEIAAMTGGLTGRVVPFAQID